LKKCWFWGQGSSFACVIGPDALNRYLLHAGKRWCVLCMCLQVALKHTMDEEYILSLLLNVVYKDFLNRLEINDGCSYLLHTCRDKEATTNYIMGGRFSKKKHKKDERVTQSDRAVVRKYSGMVACLAM
jgi:hypothetical protein